MSDNSPPPPYGPQPGSQPGYGPQPGSQPGHGQPPPQYGPAPQYGPPPQYSPPPHYGPPPQYGQYGQQPQFPPRIDSKAIKPRLWWIGLVWGVFVVCAIAGVVVFSTGLVSSVSDIAPSRTFAAGESVTIPVDPADRPAVYLSSDTQVNYVCEISGQAKLAKTTGRQTVTSGSVTWVELFVINAPSKGDYQLTCTTQEQADVRYGVGRPLASAAGGIAGGVAALLLIPGAGLLVAVIGTIVVLVRRSGARKRLAVTG
ncbi:hypothetical protein [Nonomuraea helvata]|uniref:Serine/arginine repetitive matrix protein 2 n=1 Tax=Nonomuraea helvata TaxID=37484 RepID=A0ABV5S3B4_9ACTN